MDPLASLEPRAEAEALLETIVETRLRLMAIAHRALPPSSFARFQGRSQPPVPEITAEQPPKPALVAETVPTKTTPPPQKAPAPPPPAPPAPVSKSKMVIQGGNRPLSGSAPAPAPQRASRLIDQNDLISAGLVSAPASAQVQIPSKPSSTAPRPAIKDSDILRGEMLEAPEDHDEIMDIENDPLSIPGGSGLRVWLGRQRKPVVHSPSSGPRLTEESQEQYPDSLTMDPAAFQKMLLASTGTSDSLDETRLAELESEANLSIRRGDLKRAVELYSEFLDYTPDDTGGLITRGRCFLDMGDFGAAMSDFQKAQDLEPDSAAPFVGMGDVYFARKDYRRAIDFFDHAISIDKDQAMAWCRKGICNYYRKNYTEAVQNLQRALALDSKIPNLTQYIKMVEKKLDAEAGGRGRSR